MADPIVGGSGSTLYGTTADDIFELSGAPSLVDGLAGNDTIVLTASIVFAAGSIVNIENFKVRGGFKATLSALTAGYNVSAPPGETKSINVIGSTGADTIIGGHGNDTLDGAQGNDVIDGGKGNDSITGGPGYDLLLGGEGDDFLQVKRGTGGDYVDGGSGTDRASIDVFTRVESLTLDLTNPSISQSLGEGSTIVGIEQISIIGGSGNDRFTGGLLADTLSGNDGDDVLRGGGGNDTIGGGNHYDVAVFNGAFADYQITDLGGGSYRVTSAAEGIDTLTGIETLRFADGDRPIAGYASSATYWGTTNGSARFASASAIPDGRGATPGTGFTITGLVRLADGTFWASNEGQANQADTTYTPSLVHMAANGTTKLGEIVLPSSVRAVQGLAVDEAGGRLFYASLSERLIRIVSYSGAQVGTMTLPSGAPNALTYDSALNALVIGLSDGSSNNKVVQWRSLADNTLIKSLNVGVNPDHLYLDTTKGTAGTLYVSYGEAPGTGYIAEFDVASSTRTGVWALPEADAIEGIVIAGTTIWAANDAYYHHGDPPKNQILSFVIDQANAYQLIRSGTTVGLDIDLARHDQTLLDGTRLVGVERLFFKGGDGGDIVRGGRFNDVLVGNDGADHLHGGGGNDRLVGSAQDDVLEGGTGDDGLEGGSGFDTALYRGTLASYRIDQLSSNSVRITDLATDIGAEGVDLVAEVEQFRFADGTFSFAELLEPPPPPVITYTGTSGNDTITSDADFINGRKGNDIIFATNPRVATVSGGEGNDHIEYTGVGGRLVAHGEDSADTIIGGSNADQLYGEGGADTISGNGGNDTLNGGDRNDTISGGDGDDNIVGGTGADLLYGGAGDDSLAGGTEEDVLEGGTGADWLDGGSQYDTASYASASGSVHANLMSTATNTGEAIGDTYISIENLIGSAFNDELLGTDSANRLTGGTGDDVLAGYGGADVLLGGDGNDAISGQGGNDQIDGGRGDDTFSGGLISNDVFVFARALVNGQPPVGWGADVITDFEQGRDHLNLSGSGLTFAGLTIMQQGSDTMIVEPDSDSSILLRNQNASLLTSSDFYF